MYALAVTRRAALTLLVLGALLAAAVVVRLVARLDLDGLTEAARAQVWELRARRVVCGTVVGVCLGVGGVLLQSLLRNPLASPDLLGLSSGAGLAVTISVYLSGAAGGAGAALGAAGWQTAPALAGAMAVLALVYALSQRRGLVDPASLILVGVIVGIMCAAATMLVQHLMPDRGLGAARLLMGTLSDETTWGQLAVGGAIAAAGLGVGVWAGPAMDAAAMGDDEARSVGVALGRLRAVQFVTAGAVSGAAVVIAGPIGFVGLIGPHLVRLMAGGWRRGPGHRVLAAGSALAGAALVVGADAAVKAMDLASGRLPIGVVTALLGGPAFLVLLRRRDEW